MNVAGMVILALERIRAQRGEAHGFYEIGDGTVDECGLCGRPRDDKVHADREDNGNG